jgi:hypothetical protein
MPEACNLAPVFNPARGVGDVAVRVGPSVEGVYLGSPGDVVRGQDGFAGRLEGVQVAYGPPDLRGGLTAVAVVEEVLLADAAHGLDVVVVHG